MNTGKNRRKSERYESNLFANLEDNRTKSRVGRGVVIDVSITGFALDTEADLEPGTELTCHIEIPIALKAEVVRRLSPGQMKRYGLKIKGQGFLDKIVLKKLLKGKRSTKRFS